MITAICEPQINDNILNNVNSAKNSTTLVGLKHCFNRKHVTLLGLGIVWIFQKGKNLIKTPTQESIRL